MARFYRCGRWWTQPKNNRNIQITDTTFANRDRADHIETTKGMTTKRKKGERGTFTHNTHTHTHPLKKK